ncbi:MAG: hypothetical protein DCF22_15380 [Leptolyngbya sp.]|nr:MAG: hypothetical protein DCF22_15380 [Leptolyngbya sp.]
MARQLKRWESPRKEGRNDKGRGGSARQRQRKKQFQALRKKLKQQSDGQDNKNQTKKREADLLPFSFGRQQLDWIGQSTVHTTPEPFFGLAKAISRKQTTLSLRLFSASYRLRFEHFVPICPKGVVGRGKSQRVKPFLEID